MTGAAPVEESAGRREDPGPGESPGTWPAVVPPGRPAPRSGTDLKTRRVPEWLWRWGPRPALWIELLVIAWMCWLYDDLTNLAPVRAALAHTDAGRILSAERFLHINVEARLDHWLSGRHGLAVFVANYYDNAHFVVTLGLVAALWFFWPEIYRPLRNNLVVMSLLAMGTFALFPTAPPRLFDPARYPDVVERTHAFGSWHSGTLSHAADQFAAMPSLHIGWACWSSLAAYRILQQRRAEGQPPRAALLVWIYPATTVVAVMATGNHFALDVVGGVTIFALSTLLCDRLGRRRGRRAGDEIRLDSQPEVTAALSAR